jgi:nucleoside-diphosphate-sugar epimerase
LSPFPGPRDGYQSFVHLDDAAAAVLAALDVPGGVYNVAEDEPATRRELAKAVGTALGRRPGLSLPGLTKLGGAKTEFMGRSVRVSNRKFRDLSSWKPAYSTPADGWARVAAAEGAGRPT